MSADNYLAIHHFGASWYVYMAFASNEEFKIPPDSAHIFETKKEAVNYAETEQRNNYYEYGIRFI